MADSRSSITRSIAADCSQLHADHFLSLNDYERVRKETRKEVIAIKKNRRMDVGPIATFYFENAVTMWSQIQEMLWIEKGGDAQLQDELQAYNPLIPQGHELVATLMLEIDDTLRRKRVLSRLGGIETHIYLTIDQFRIRAEPEEGDGVERTKDDGKTSAIHFLHFPFTPEQEDAFRSPDCRVVLNIEHENYMHMAIVPPAVRNALQADFKR